MCMHVILAVNMPYMYVCKYVSVCSCEFGLEGGGNVKVFTNMKKQAGCFLGVTSIQSVLCYIVAGCCQRTTCF